MDVTTRQLLERARINCDKDENCQGFVFDRPQSWCQLKSSKTPKKYIQTRDFYSKVVPGAAPDAEDEQPAEAANDGPFAVTSKHESHKNGTPLGNFWVQPQDCANRKPGEKFLVTDSQGYQQVFGAKAINTSDAGLCFVQPDRRPPTVKLATSPMLRWVVGDEAFLTNPNALVAREPARSLSSTRSVSITTSPSVGTRRQYKFLKLDKSVPSSRPPIHLWTGIPGVARCVKTPDFEFGTGNKNYRTRQHRFQRYPVKCVVKASKLITISVLQEHTAPPLGLKQLNVICPNNKSTFRFMKYIPDTI